MQRWARACWWNRTGQRIAETRGTERSACDCALPGSPASVLSLAVARSLASVVRDVDAILQGLSAATAGLPATLPPTSEPTKEFVARQHTKLAPYKPHAPGASSSFHDALSPGGADPLKERADDLLRAMV